MTARDQDIAFAGTISETDYLAAVRTIRGETGRPILAIIMLVGMVALLVVNSSTIAAFLVALWLAITLEGLLFSRLYVRRAVRTGPAVLTPMEGTADANGIRSESAIGSLNAPWTTFYKRVVTDDHVLPFMSSRIFYLYPRHFLGTDDDWATFCGYVTEALPAKNTTTRPRLVVAMAILSVLLGALSFVI